MKMFNLTTLLALSLSLPISASEKCAIKMENAAIFELAQSLPIPISNVFRVRNEGGAWTESIANNRGTAEVAVAREAASGDKISYYRVSAEQVGRSDDCKIVSVESLAASDIDPLVRQAEKYKLAIKNALYYSEADFPWEVFYSHQSVGAGFPIDEVRVAIGAGNEHVEVWTHKNTLDFLTDASTPDEDRTLGDDAFRYKLLTQALLKDFKQLRVFKVGKPDSGSLDLYLVGRTPEGKLLGLKTMTVET